MVNGLSVLGWGVGGIEAEAAMLGQPISMLIPEVVGVEIKGKLLEGLTATDLVLAIVEMLRKKGVVGKFVEFYGEGLKNLTLADRATIANMAPEYGATCGFFPVDEETLKYLKLSGRDNETIELVEKYSKAQGLWASEGMEFTDTISLDISTVVPSISGPKRPQDKVLLTNSAKSFAKAYKENTKREKPIEVNVAGADFKIKDVTPKGYGPADEACWPNYKQVGLKKKGKKMVPNCVPEETNEDVNVASSVFNKAKFIRSFKEMSADKAYKAMDKADKQSRGEMSVTDPKKAVKRRLQAKKFADYSIKTVSYTHLRSPRD